MSTCGGTLGDPNERTECLAGTGKECEGPAEGTPPQPHSDPKTVEEHPEDTFCQAAILPQYLGTEALKQERERPSEHAAAPQSKNARKRARNEEKAAKVCNAVLRGGLCTFQNCKYSHDLESYLRNKPADLGPECHLFKTFGACGAGLMCRYGNSHIKDGKNVIDEEKNKLHPKPEELNKLSKELQNDLRKKTYFKKISENPIPSEQKPLQDAPALPATASMPEHKELPITTFKEVPLRPEERKRIDWGNKLYLASLTTVGNLPFRRICKGFGCDVTLGEMAMCGNLLQGQSSEWALIKRHPCEDLFGIQLCCSNADIASRCVKMLEKETEFDFVDLNAGCPIDVVYSKGCGASLLERPKRIGEILTAMKNSTTRSVSVKLRIGKDDKNPTIDTQVIPYLKEWGASFATIHGRSRLQRYSKLADWNYIGKCNSIAQKDEIPIIGNGDILSFVDYNHAKEISGVSGVNLARGALIKPWIFTEIKEQRHWDISSSERLDMLRNYANYGLEHWGSDTQGVEHTRTFLCHWLSFLSRYVPVGILERVPVRMNEHIPTFIGRDDLETLMSSPRVDDWVKLTELVLGPAPSDFKFEVKHKSYAI